MTALHSRAWTRLAEVRALADLRGGALDILAKMGSQRPYDAANCISLAPYEDLLPKVTIGKLRYYESLRLYPREGIPFPVLKEECAEAISLMGREAIVRLLLRLAFDISNRQNSFAEQDRARVEAIVTDLADDELALLI